MSSTPSSNAVHPRARNVTVVLGPTNTGKTHLAVERMLSHETGMIGLPLRLLAREIYDKVVERAGEQAAALITGEEKIVPPEPRYFICTVEAMPNEVEVDFLAIDEVQLATDLERGHIFTDRLMHRRGHAETMILGAATMRALVEQLLPGAHFISRARFSQLTYTGQKKMTRLPPRSAIVCFSADRVYTVAELIRRQRGGAAVVMGALSPRTRNAQVELYQSGDVDFLVATDAIGMGLNMDVDHVAFAATTKFDGHMFRGLTPAELAQIAGRAGRHMNDGTFGVTGEADPLEADVVEQLESHRFDPVRVVQWRNRHLDFSSIESLAASLNRAPNLPGLTRALRADDMTALDLLSRDPKVREKAGSEDGVRSLWEVCQIPDYRNITGGDHAALLGKVFGYLSSGSGHIPTDWFARQVSYADQTGGDLDTLSNRIAHIRTWTYIANKNNWLEDPADWQQRTRLVEDRLSDALHEHLTKRFIDRRTSVLMKRMREKEKLMAAVSDEGDITVEGEFVGTLNGFQFSADADADGAHGRTLRSASMKAVAAEIAAKARRFAQVPDTALQLTLDGTVLWDGARVARLEPGDHVLKPRAQLLASDQLSGADRDLVQERVDRWIAAQIKTHLEPLMALEKAEGIDGLARGLAFRLVEAFGVLRREDVADDVKQLDQPMRAGLRQLGVRFGAYSIYLPALLKPAATRLKLILWGLARQAADGSDPADLPEPPQQGLTSTRPDPKAPDGFYQLVGYRVCGARVVRIDMLERLSDLIRPLVYWKPQKPEDVRPAGSVEGGGFTVTPDMMSLVGCSGEEFGSILQSLGFHSQRREIRKPDGEDAPQTPAPAPEAPVAEANAETAAATDTAEAQPAADAASEADAAPAETPQASAVEETVATAEAEPEFIEVWKPKSAKRKQGGGRRQPASAKADRTARPRRGKQQKKPQDKPQRKRSGPKPAPADSPFAALGALKASLEEQQRKGSK